MMLKITKKSDSLDNDIFSNTFYPEVLASGVRILDAMDDLNFTDNDAELKLPETFDDAPVNEIELVNEEVVEEVVEENLDTVSNELQKLLYSSGQQKITKSLLNLNFKGKLQSNPILRTMQVLQNFNTITKMKSLINELMKK